MGYNLPDHELFILNREYGISYRKLAEEWRCGQSTIGNRVRQFEECLDSGNVDAIDLYEVTSMKFKRVPEYIDMIEDMKIEQNDNYTDELNGITVNGITDASPEESAEDMMPVGVRDKTEQGFWESVWSVLKEIVWW